MPGHQEAQKIDPNSKPDESVENSFRLQDTSIWHGDGVITPIDQNQSLMMLNNYNEASDNDDAQSENKDHVIVANIIDIDFSKPASGSVETADWQHEQNNEDTSTQAEVEALMAVQVPQNQSSSLPQDLFASETNNQQEINL